MIKLSTLKISKELIQSNRNKIYNEFIANSSNINSGIITQISPNDLKLLFSLYDKIFFNNYFKNNFKSKLVFSLSPRMTNSAGKLIYPKNLPNIKIDDAKFELRMGINFFFKYYETNDDKIANGIKTKDSLEAFMIVFEHELCHLIELIDYNYTNCKKDNFKKISFDIFRHTNSYHELPTHKKIAVQKYGFKIGDAVSFIHNKKKNTGFIYNINQRATIMVKNTNGQYIDDNGNKYVKYYVSLDKLIPEKL